MMEKVINRPLAPTFGWLHVNGTKVSLKEQPEPETLTLKEGEERTLVLEEAAELTAEVGPGAALRLIQVRRGGSAQEVTSLRIRCAEGAHFAWYRVVLGGDATYDNCSVELAGEGSSFRAEIGYRLGGREKLDANCEVIHTGRKTESLIHASGVLAEHSRKVLRGTIDFRTGCSGAVGNESEEALLLDETVQNQSVPVILCAEEDVVGNHGASIGQLDENVVYYLESRGLSRETVYETMARARLDAVIRTIPEEKIRAELLGETQNGAEVPGGEEAL